MTATSTPNHSRAEIAELQTLTSPESRGAGISSSAAKPAYGQGMINRTGAKLTRVFELANCDLLLQLISTFGIEWRHAGHHLKQQDPNTPPVNIFAMAFPLNDLRSHVLHGPDETVCALPVGHIALGQAKVGDPDVPITV